MRIPTAALSVTPANRQGFADARCAQLERQVRIGCHGLAAGHGEQGESFDIGFDLRDGDLWVEPLDVRFLQRPRSRSPQHGGERADLSRQTQIEFLFWSDSDC